VVLSHAHHDHTGGLEAVLSKNRGVPIYAHSDIFRPRYSFRQGAYQSIAMTLSAKDLASRAELRLSDLPMEIFPGLWTTGEILERPEPEGRSAHHAIRSDDHWRPDPYRDDLALVLETQAGLAVICGCCHAGLLNTLFHVQRTFERPILAILGGMHLVTADDLYLDLSQPLYGRASLPEAGACLRQLGKALPCRDSRRLERMIAGTDVH